MHERTGAQRPKSSTGWSGKWLVVLGIALGAILVARLARAEEITTMIRYVDAKGVVHYVGSLDQVPPEYRASAKVPDSDLLRLPPVTSIGNDRYGRQAREMEYKQRLERRAREVEKLEQEYRELLQQEAGPRAESAARKGVEAVTEREKLIKERKAVEADLAAERAKWLASCERQERIVDYERAKHWKLYGQRWSDEETAARKKMVVAASGCQPAK